MPSGRSFCRGWRIALVSVLLAGPIAGCQSGDGPASGSQAAAPVQSSQAEVATPITLGDDLDNLSDDARNAALTLKSLSEDAFSLLSDPVISETERRERFRLLFNDGFDLPAIGRFVLGSHWDQASGVQRRLFLQLYEDLIVNSYAQRFRDYSGQGFRITDAQEVNPDIQVVSSTVVTPTGGTVPVDWTMRRTDFDYQVVDVAVEGISLGRTQQDEYGSVVERRGIDGLLEVLEQRVAELEG